jgi:hypothetical protein
VDDRAGRNLQTMALTLERLAVMLEREHRGERTRPPVGNTQGAERAP